MSKKKQPKESPKPPVDYDDLLRKELIQAQQKFQEWRILVRYIKEVQDLKQYFAAAELDEALGYIRQMKTEELKLLLKFVSQATNR